MGIGIGTGENRAVDAARAAVMSPLLEVNITGARGILFNVTGGSDLGLFEVNEAAEVIKEVADPEANIIFGTVIDDRMRDEIKVTVIATGFDSSRKPKQANGQTRPMPPAAWRPRSTSAAARSSPRSSVTASSARPSKDQIGAVAVRPSCRSARRPRSGHRPQAAAGVVRQPGAAPSYSETDLDIPSFLRRKRTRPLARPDDRRDPARWPGLLLVRRGTIRAMTRRSSDPRSSRAPAALACAAAAAAQRPRP